MLKTLTRSPILMILAGAALLLAGGGSAEAEIPGLTGASFDLTAKTGHITTPDGLSLYAWGYANGAGMMQYPGPTLIVDQGDIIEVHLTNSLDVPVSIVFPGQESVTAVETAAPTQAGLLTLEALPGGTVTYSFTASHAGTYQYHSGTQPELQVALGLVGAIVVRPLGFDPDDPRAYGHADSAYDYEYLFLLTEMDPRINDLVEMDGPAALEEEDYLSDFFPNFWFINGRCAPDTMFPMDAPWLPTQPYDCMPRACPGEKALMRVVNAGRDLHPFHHHGNHARIIARNGRLLESAPASGADLSQMVFTIQAVPGETVDAIFSWTGARLGWDVYGHEPGDPLEPGEYEPDHGKPFPVVLPENQVLTFGGFYSGSPFLGVFGELPPGEGGLNENGGFYYMWHSHTEKEMVNFDLFPGGMMTMFVVEPPGVVIPK